MAKMWVNKSGLLMFDIDILETKCDQGYYQFKLTGHKKINQYDIYIYIICCKNYKRKSRRHPFRFVLMIFAYGMFISLML